MALDGKLLAAAKTAYAAMKLEHEKEYDRRLREVYAKAPRVKELDDKLRLTMLDTLRHALGGANAIGAMDGVMEQNLALQDERAAALRAAGFPRGYIDDMYMCQTCRDTGYSGTRICDCLMALYKREQAKSLSSLLKLGNETFENFDLSYYSETPDEATGISPRYSMQIVYETCRQYAQKFGKRSLNLFLNGAPGLGKTFLSACIARVVAESGYSVVYDTAASVFAKFEDDRFGRGADPSAAREEARRCLDCDLLILDDLGTEMTTAFTISALYELINTRLISGNKTIISSNLPISDLRRRYSEQIMSRLEGEYQVLTFYGEDIRRQKKLRGY